MKRRRTLQRASLFLYRQIKAAEKHAAGHTSRTRGRGYIIILLGAGAAKNAFISLLILVIP